MLLEIRLKQSRTPKSTETIGIRFSRRRRQRNVTNLRIEGKEGISATILADSVSSVSGKRITTFELEYPRLIHSELMTHRLFSRNAASSRAIPIKKKIKMIWNNPAMPVHWGKNQPGMQAKAEIQGFKRSLAKFAWKTASTVACISTYTLFKLGIHKQIVNRILEPFERYKVVLTATEYENWFWLRDHEDAQPEIRELAGVMNEARRLSNPKTLYPGEWHLPYVHTQRDLAGPIQYVVDGKEIDLETAQQVSASCCAQVSYRVLNQSIEKAKDIFDKLINSVPVHASPTEHQATPMKCFDQLSYVAAGNDFEDGITHVKTNNNLNECDLWSGNLCSWIQYRQLIPNNVKM